MLDLVTASGKLRIPPLLASISRVLAPESRAKHLRAGIASVERAHTSTVLYSAAVSQRFAIPITASPADIDELGHVSNLVYVRWVLDVAMAHSRALGWDHAQYRALGAIFVVRRHEVDYVAQVREGEQLVAETWVEDWRLASCVRRTELRRGDQVVARGATTWAMISLATGRPQRIPDELRALFS